MIELLGVTKSYPVTSGRRCILDNVTASFVRGRSVGLLGRNGAGKSTLLRVIAGTEQIEAGAIRRDVRISWPLGFGGGFHGSLSGAENIRFVSRIYDVDPCAVAAFVRDFSELGAYLDEPVKTYSSGMKARLAFGLSMAIDFDVYLVDEITGVGDRSFQNKCRDAFKTRLSHSDVIMVSHSMATIKEYCDSAVVLDQGRLHFFDEVGPAVKYYEEVLA